MAKAISLDDNTLSLSVDPPRAASVAQKSPNSIPSPPKKAKEKSVKVPLQILLSPEDAKAIKHAAIDADLTNGDFLSACFHAFMKK